MDKWKEEAMRNGWIPMQEVVIFLENRLQSILENYEMRKRLGVDNKDDLMQLQIFLSYFRLYNSLPKEIDDKLKELLDISKMKLNG